MPNGREFMSFIGGTSRSSAPSDDDGHSNDENCFLVAALDRWGDRMMPRRDEDREMMAAPRPGWPFS